MDGFLAPGEVRPDETADLGKCDYKVGRLFCLINTLESHKQVLFSSKEEAWEAGRIVLGILPPLRATPRCQ